LSIHGLDEVRLKFFELASTNPGLVPVTSVALESPPAEAWYHPLNPTVTPERRDVPEGEPAP
jgi:hypothetical protein